jgi:hypothetical protein
MVMATPRRYIIAVAPHANAGIGDALRRAYSKPELSRPVTIFERLIARLDRLG